jgi:hypothetical protein
MANAQITFTTKQVEASANQILLSRATRASKKDGKEVPAAFKPLFATVEIPEAVSTIDNEFIKLAALNGIQQAYQKIITAKLPLDLLRTSNGADQVISIDSDDLLSALKAEAGEARRITKEAINDAWKVVVAGALHNLCKLKNVSSESELPDNIRRQVGAQLQKRADFLLSMASTTGIQLRNEEELTSSLEWLIKLVENEAAADNGQWVFSAILGKINARIEKLAELKLEPEEEIEVSEVDVLELF